MPEIVNNRFFAACDEVFIEGRDGTALDVSGDREYKRYYLVMVKMKEISAFQVCLCPGIPALGSVYVHPNQIQYDALAQAARISAKQQVNDDWGNWIVTVEYTTKVPEEGISALYTIQGARPQDIQDRPWLDPVKMDFGSEIQHEAPPHDRRQKAFLNSAEMPLTPAPSFEIANSTVTITKNLRVWDADLQDKYAFALNDRLFLGREAGMAQCLPPDVKQASRGRQKYYRGVFKVRLKRLDPISYTVVLSSGGSTTTSTTTTSTSTTPREGGTIVTIQPPPLPRPPIVRGWRTWQPRLLDNGMMERVPVSGPGQPGDDPKFSYRDIWGSSGRPVSSPVLLDGNGRRQTARDENGNLIPIYLDFEYYQYVDLNTLFQVQ